MNNVCTYFQNCSTEIKQWLIKQPEVKEESLTDWFLYNLSEKIPTVKYKQFSRMEEGRKTGADWEWWFVFSENNSFAARVQAKKLKPIYDNYPGLAYISNNKLQIERLLEDSSKDGFTSFYVFYSIEQNRYTMCGGRIGGEGVYIGEANELRRKFILQSRRKLRQKDILKHTNPISCLFCCPITYQQKSIAAGFREHVLQYFPTYNENLGEQRNIEELGFRKTPKYILQFISDDIPEYWENEYRFHFERTNAIIAIDLRDFNNHKYG